MNEFQRQVRQIKNELKKWWSDTTAKDGGGNKRPEHKMCPVCAKFNEKNAHTCYYCEAELAPKPISDFKSDGSVSRPMNPVFFIFGLCVLLQFVAISLSSKTDGYDAMGKLWSPTGEVLALLGSNYSPATVNGGEYWRLATYMFLHGGMFHLFMNLSALGFLGGMTWQNFGVRRFWMIALATGIAGGFASAFSINILGPVNSMGFSGALFGMLGANYIHCRRNGEFFLAERLKKYMVWGNLICILITISPIPFNIDNMAHLGGMFAGLGIAQFLYTKNTSEMKEWLVVAFCGLMWLYGLFRVFQYVEAYFKG